MRRWLLGLGVRWVCLSCSRGRLSPCRPLARAGRLARARTCRPGRRTANGGRWSACRRRIAGSRVRRSLPAGRSLSIGMAWAGGWSRSRRSRAAPRRSRTSPAGQRTRASRSRGTRASTTSGTAQLESSVGRGRRWHGGQPPGSRVRARWALPRRRRLQTPRRQREPGAGRMVAPWLGSGATGSAAHFGRTRRRAQRRLVRELERLPRSGHGGWPRHLAAGGRLAVVEGDDS